VADDGCAAQDVEQFGRREGSCGVEKGRRPIFVHPYPPHRRHAFYVSRCGDAGPSHCSGEGCEYCSIVRTTAHRADAQPNEDDAMLNRPWTRPPAMAMPDLPQCAAQSAAGQWLRLSRRHVPEECPIFLDEEHARVAIAALGDLTRIVRSPVEIWSHNGDEANCAT
jgi:hypothetical protein